MAATTAGSSRASSRAALALLAVLLVHAQQPQNPSPMVEHSRPHPRLAEEHPAGRREKLEFGTLYIPPRTRPILLLFFHGGVWLPEVAAARARVSVISIQAGAGSAAYARLFEDPQRFPQLVADAESKAGIRFDRIWLGGWSAGCGAIRQILGTPASYERVSSILAIDGIHTDYVDGKPGPLESKIGTANLEVWLQLARDAAAGRKRLVITHTEIFPGTFASTTETADYLAGQLGIKPRPFLHTGPMGLQELNELRAGKLLLIGYAGNSAPNHVDQLHALPEFLRWL
jgi:hypothetical protein